MATIKGVDARAVGLAALRRTVTMAHIAEACPQCAAAWQEQGLTGNPATIIGQVEAERAPAESLRSNSR